MKIEYNDDLHLHVAEMLKQNHVCKHQVGWSSQREYTKVYSPVRHNQKTDKRLVICNRKSTRTAEADPDVSIRGCP